MSTAPTPVVAAPVTSEWSKIEGGVLGFAKKVKAGIEDAGEDAVKLAAWLQTNQTEITGLAALAGTKSSSAVAAGQALLGAAVNVATTQGTAALANGLNIPADSAAIQAVEAFIADLKKLI